MGPFTPRITRQRLLGAGAILLAAIVFAYLAGADMSGFGLGLLFGIVIVGVVAAFALRSARRSAPDRRDGDSDRV